MNYRDDVLYTKDHIWAKLEDNYYLIGITFFAQELLGDIVYLDIKNGKVFEKSSAIGIIESVKTASDIVAPDKGEIIQINSEIEKQPEKINENPHGSWICKVRFASEKSQIDFLSQEEYLNLIKT
jgi:glycine cleavage system H protein|tara:strand:- start:21097 stop:21471 length:375 start_codon:yes stop_codon:yes gene_type:complete